MTVLFRVQGGGKDAFYASLPPPSQHNEVVIPNGV